MADRVSQFHEYSNRHILWETLKARIRNQKLSLHQNVLISVRTRTLICLFSFNTKYYFQFEIRWQIIFVQLDDHIDTFHILNMFNHLIYTSQLQQSWAWPSSAPACIILLMLLLTAFSWKLTLHIMSSYILKYETLLNFEQK